MNKSIKRISFRLKDLFTAIQDKETLVRIFYDEKEIDYNDLTSYKDMYVCNVGIGTESDKPCLMISVNESVELIYYPLI